MTTITKRPFDYDAYPLGTKAYSYMGGYWIKVKDGWKWFCGDTFSYPACLDVVGIEIPTEEKDQ